MCSHKLHLLLCHVVSVGLKLMLQFEFFSAEHPVYAYTHVWSLEQRCIPGQAQAVIYRDGREGPGMDLWRLYGHRVTWLGEHDPRLKQNYLQLYFYICIYTHMQIYDGAGEEKKSFFYCFCNITGIL